MRKNQPYEDLAEKEYVWDYELRKNICNWRSERSGRQKLMGQNENIPDKSEVGSDLIIEDIIGLG